MTNSKVLTGGVATNILVLFSGALITVLILGLSSGILTNWVKTKFGNQLALAPTPTPSVEPIATVKSSESPKPSTTPEPSYKPTNKGGVVLGDETPAATKKPITSSNFSFATVVYEYKDKNSSNWLTRGNYDTRFESYIDFDAVSPSYDRKVTLCLYRSDNSNKCESGKVDPAIYTYDYIVGGKKLVYEIVGDKNGPTMAFEGPWKNGSSTCVKVINIQDNLSPVEKIIKSERMDNGEWRDLHNEYCVSGNAGDKHSYQVRAKDEAGNETTSTFTFPIL